MHDPRIVGLELIEGLPWLRESPEARVQMHCIREAQRDDFRSVHDSIQSDHVQLIFAADDEQALSSRRAAGS